MHSPSNNDNSTGQLSPVFALAEQIARGGVTAQRDVSKLYGFDPSRVDELTEAQAHALYRALIRKWPTLDDEKAALLRFAGDALTETRIREIGDWDGGAIEDALMQCGLIERVGRQVPCGEGCRCLDFYDTGETAECYPITPLGKQAVAAFRAWQDEQTTASSPAPEED